MHVTRTTEGWLRLCIAVVLNFALWLLLQRGSSPWDTYKSDAFFLIFKLAVAAVALVATIPLFWRGKPWQAPIAFVLLWLPALFLGHALMSVAGIG
jgi:hypothetical protein